MLVNQQNGDLKIAVTNTAQHVQTFLWDKQMNQKMDEDFTVKRQYIADH